MRASTIYPSFTQHAQLPKPRPQTDLVVLLDDALCCQGVVLQITGQAQHVLRQLLLQTVVALQDGVQLSC